MRAYLSLKHNFNGSSGGAADGSFEEMFPSFIASKVRNIRHRPLLNKIPLFNGGGGDGDGQDARVTDVAFMTALTARATEEVLMDGMRIFEQDDIAQECYVLTSGKAVVLVPDNDDQEQEVLICNAGSVLGAESFFSGLMMPYAIKILGTSRTLKLTNSERDELFHGFPEQGRWIMGQLTDLNAQKKRCAEDAIEYGELQQYPNPPHVARSWMSIARSNHIVSDSTVCSSIQLFARPYNHFKMVNC